MIDAERGDERSWEAAVEVFDRTARRFPGTCTRPRWPGFWPLSGARRRRPPCWSDCCRRRSRRPARAGSVRSRTCPRSRPRRAAGRGGAAVRGAAALRGTPGGGAARSGQRPGLHYLGLLAAGSAARTGGNDFEDAIALAERIGAGRRWPIAWWHSAEVLRLRGADGDARRRPAATAWPRARRRAGLTRCPPAHGAPDEWALRRDGDGWVLQAGDEHARLADSRGLQQLRVLLAAPRRDIPALDLAAGGPGLRAPAAPPVLDSAAAASYRQRLGELAAELDAADAAGDAGRASRAEAERQWLLAELRRSTGLGGTAPPHHHRVRTGQGERDPDAACRGRPHLRRGAAGRRAPAGIRPYRAGLPLRPRPRRPVALAACERIVRSRRTPPA